MVGSEPVIYKPQDGTVLKYSVSNRNEDGIVAMSQQTLVSSSFSQTGTTTTMELAKLLLEPDSFELEIVYGNNNFVWAVGSGNLFGYHLERGSLFLDLSATSSPSASPTPVPTNAPAHAEPHAFANCK